MQPGRGTPSLRILSGGGVSDTVDALLSQPLVVEVRGQGGAVLPNARVRFAVSRSADSATLNVRTMGLCALVAQDCQGGNVRAEVTIDSTDAQGRARVKVRMGILSGRGMIRVAVPDLNLSDSATYVLQPGNADHFAFKRRFAAVDIGGSSALGTRIVDRNENLRPDGVTYGSMGGAVLALAPTTGVVSGVAFGSQWVSVVSAALRDSILVSVVPPGRLAVWSVNTNSVRLVNTSGVNIRELFSPAFGSYGVFPRFDLTRQNVTLHTNTGLDLQSRLLVSVDTASSARRTVPSASNVSNILASRTLAGGIVRLIATRATPALGQVVTLYSVALNGDVTPVVDLPGGVLDNGGGDISPDGRYIAYVAYDAQLRREIRVFDVDAGLARTVVVNARAPRFSPLGDRIAFFDESTASRQLAVVNADGTALRRLSAEEFEPGLSWSPDATYIVGRSGVALRFVRLSDLATVPVRYYDAAGIERTYFEPDWR